MTLTTAATGFILFFIQVVQGQGGWGVTYTSTKVCALKGSTVELRCTYTHPSPRNWETYRVEKSFWFTKVENREPVDLSTDSEYRGRVTSTCQYEHCTLRITDVRESDSAEYKFRLITKQPDGRYIGVPGVTLTVRDPDLQVTVSRSAGYSWTELKCLSTCSLPSRPSYVWYKNGGRIWAETSSYSVYTNYGDSFSCALKGFEDFPSPPVCVYKDWCNKVTYSSRRICAPKGSSVDVSCSYKSYGGITSKSWFSPGLNGEWQSPSHVPGRVEVLEDMSGRSTLRISDLRESDSAEYRFRFTSGNFEWGNSLPGTTLTVTDLQVQVRRITAGEHQTEAELRCHSSCSPADRLSYVWFMNGDTLTWERTSSYTGWVSVGEEISCAFQGHGRFPSPSVYAPKPPSVSVSPSEIVEGSSVTLSCSSDANPAATYTWFKKNKNLDFQPLRKEAQLVLRSIQSSDSGEYYCEAENELGKRTSERLPIDVTYAPRLPSVSVSPSAKIVEGSSVTLNCSSDANPAATYTWFKKNKNLDFQPLRKEAQLVLRSIQSSDSGEYYCEAENELGKRTSERLPIDVTYAPRLPSVSVSPSAKIVEGSSVTLNCSSDANPAATYTWFKKNKNLDFQPLRKEAQLVLRSIQSSDSGEYYCEAENELGKRTSERLPIDVTYAPRLPSVSVSPSAKIVEGSSVTLNCSSDANPAATYTWFKKIQGPPLGQQQLYHITSISPEQGGSYFCTSANRHGQINSSAVFIEVNYAPKLSSVSVTGEFLEGSSVTLTCKSDANPAATNTWYKEDHTPLQGRDGVHFFPSIRSKDSGLYYCKSNNSYGQRNSTSHRIDVQYPPRPPSVSVSRSDPMMEGSSVTLNCSSDANPAANYTWYKKNEPTFNGSGPVFTISDVRVKHSGDYYCEARNSRGYQNSTFLSVAVSRSMKAVAAGSISAILLVIFFLVTLFIWRKKSLKETSQPAGRPVNNRQTTSPREEKQEELSYASVRFSNHQDEAIYYNISIPPKGNRAKRKEEEDEDDVEYSVVNFQSNRPSPQSSTQRNDDDLSAVYSTVMKTQRV